MRRICVFCGSKLGGDGRYRDAAERLGQALVQRGCSLVYGGGSVGLMGVLADAVLAGGGEVIGVIPQRLATKELLHTGVPTMHVVASMHERKARMEELAYAFVALPGGFGTFEEFFEMVTWAQLGIHRKPIGLLDVAGYFTPLVELVEHAIAEGFIKSKHRQLIVLGHEPVELLDRLAAHHVPTVRQWMQPDQT